jgi:hypothetical protein
LNQERNEGFLYISKKLLKDFITASELKILGLRQGFYAFADGVYNDNSFHKVNKYGVVNVEGLEHVESEYRSDISISTPIPLRDLQSCQ